MMIYTKKSAAEIVGLKGINRIILQNVLLSFGMNTTALEIAYTKGYETTDVSIEEKDNSKLLVKKIKEKYNQALADHNRDMEIKLQRDAEQKSRTEKALSPMLIDIQKLAEKYSGIVGFKNDREIINPNTATYNERRALSAITILSQKIKENK